MALQSSYHSLLLVVVLAMTTFLDKASSTVGLRETKLSMYFQDFSAGPNISAVPIAGIAGKLWRFDQFGTVIVTDDRLTVAPSPRSATVGRGQGLAVTSSLDGRNAHVLLSIVFTNKKYNGSTLEIQGTSRQFEAVREVSVVSGTGKFRFARGYATFETYSVDSPNAYAVIRFNITVLH
ncbi:pterocarpan synthase 1-like [Argentina anserina]|uniref:pterocarpan synthase 1-like n=1 Tax=Argentina anserina TaxID=57926 RepID=UPI0021764E59|nr:pterocarpan synthase 1-like [Potentilla anserina]